MFGVSVVVDCEVLDVRMMDVISMGIFAYEGLQILSIEAVLP